MNKETRGRHAIAGTLKIDPLKVKEGLAKGLTNKEIAKEVGVSVATLEKHFKLLHLSRKEVKEADELEIADLTLLRARARKELHDRMDTNSLTAIELIALMDKTFQQSQILKGKSTDNLSVLVSVIEAAAK